MLLELSKCVVSKEKTVILNQDALDFLKAMDHLDMYVGVPNAVDENLYATICKHRRCKIDSEIKVESEKGLCLSKNRCETFSTDKGRPIRGD